LLSGRAVLFRSPVKRTAFLVYRLSPYLQPVLFVGQAMSDDAPGFPAPMEVDTEAPLPGSGSDLISSSVSGSSSDPASSLRAAALLTMSKRRKPTSETSSSVLPSRPLPLDTSFQLDYGQDDPSPLHSGRATTPSKSTPPPQPPAVSTKTDDDQVREEGEISDSEEPPPQLRDPTSPQESINLKISGPEKNIPSKATTPSTSTPSGNVLSAPASAQVTGQATEVPQTHTFPGPSGPPTSLTPTLDNNTVENFVVDPDHVRPGLSSM
jgi:hypothetical protein